jgi:Putative zinc- or iron-chelating domain
MGPMLTDHEEAVAQRWVELEEPDSRLPRVIAIVNEATRAIKARHHKRVNAVLNHPFMTVGAKIEALWEAVDEIGEVAAPHAACRKGCNHCCHTSVLLPAQEAALIGKRIGVKPAAVTGVTGRHDIEAGYHNPCPFLKGGACSIYTSRPLACRQQFNIDRDALLCELIDGPSKVPYLNLIDYQTALAMMTAHRREGIGRDPRSGRPVPVETITSPDVGDIREFFPKGKP